MPTLDDEPSHRNDADRQLSAAATRLYRLLSAHPGPDFALPLAAAPLAETEEETARLLAELEAGGLVTQTAAAFGPRWRMDDQARLRARQLAEAHPHEAAHAIDAVCGWYLDAAIAADQVIAPHRVRLSPRYLVVAPAAFSGPAAATDQLEVELPALVAVVTLAHSTGRYPLVWQLCEAMWGLLRARRPFEVWRETHTLGLEAARRCGEARAQARMLFQLGVAHLLLRQRDRAEGMFTAALELERRSRNLLGAAAALDGVGLARAAAGRPADAIWYHRQAAATYREQGHRRGVGLALLHIGQACRQAGDHAEAGRALANATELLVPRGDPYDQVCVTLARAHSDLDAGRLGIARLQLERALRLANDLGARGEQARTHELLAEVITRTVCDGRAGDGYAQRRAACAHLRAARDLYTVQGDHTAAADLGSRLDA